MKTTKRALSLAGILIALTAAGTALAAGYVDGAKITNVRVVNGTLVITLDRNATNSPACAADNKQRFTANLASETGREMSRLATAAFLAGRLVDVNGAGRCSEHSSKESMDDLAMR